MQTRARYERQPGFTLVELLVVIAIIGLLVAILVPAIIGAWTLAQSMECRSNLKQIATAALEYASDNRGTIVPCQYKISGLCWCDLLVKGNYLTAINTAGQTNTVTSEHGVLRCPVSEISIAGVVNPTDPTSIQAQCTERLGNTTLSVDCSYYWNGYVGGNNQQPDPTIMARYPSLLVDESATASVQASQYHDLSEIKNRTTLVMAADGILFDGDSYPARIAARHPGDHGPRGRTNLVFYDGHVDTMDRYPGKGNDWTKEAVSDSAMGLPIMSRTPNLDGGPFYFKLPLR